VCDKQSRYKRKRERSGGREIRQNYLYKSTQRNEIKGKSDRLVVMLI